MFLNEEDYTRHNRNCNTFEAIEKFEEGDVDRCVEMVGVMNDEKYKEIPRNKWSFSTARESNLHVNPPISGPANNAQ